jgi:hypothetical protein
MTVDINPGNDQKDFAVSPSHITRFPMKPGNRKNKSAFPYYCFSITFKKTNHA